MIDGLLEDESWQVRCFAALTRGRQGRPVEQAWVDAQTEPRVVRAALRCGGTLAPDRLAIGIGNLSGSNGLDDRMLAVELMAATLPVPIDPESARALDERLDEIRELVKDIVFDMRRADAGALAPRLRRITGASGPITSHEWVRWAKRNVRRFDVRHGRYQQDTGLNPIASLEPMVFRDLVRYLQGLEDRRLDLAIVIDCTASMSADLAVAQSVVTDLMVFCKDVLEGIRVGVVGYRDRRNDFETVAWNLNDDIAAVQSHLWELTAGQGGDQAEMVYEALRLAYSKMSWNTEHDMALVLIGDGPPHPGYGTKCAEMADRAAEAGLVTHVIEARGRDVRHFPDIAGAGGGRCVKLRNAWSLGPQVAGLVVGRQFESEMRAFFAAYLELCR